MMMKQLKWILILGFAVVGLNAMAQTPHLPEMTFPEVNAFMQEHPSTLVVVLLSAKWCSACHRIEPYYVRAAETLKDDGIVVVKLDYDQNPDYVRSLHINSIPQTEFYYQGLHRWKYGAGLSDTQLVREARLALDAAQNGTFSIESYSVLQSVR